MTASHKTPSMPTVAHSELQYTCTKLIYRMAGNFGWNSFWQIGKITVLGRIYIGGLASLYHNDIHSKMANPDASLNEVSGEYTCRCLTAFGLFSFQFLAFPTMYKGLLLVD